MSGQEWFLIIFAMACALLAAAAGSIYPRAQTWRYVDLVYYPLGIVGIVLLFLSTSAPRERNSIILGVRGAAHTKMAPSNQKTFVAFVQLHTLVDDYLDLDKLCPKMTSKSQFYLDFCQESWFARYQRNMQNNVDSIGYVMRSEIIDYLGRSCDDVRNNAAKPQWWAGLKHPLIPSENEIARIHKAVDAIITACEESDRVRSEAESTASIELREKLNRWHERTSTNIIPTSRELFVSTLRDSAWPFFIVLALAMKVGKTFAGMRN